MSSIRGTKRKLGEEDGDQGQDLLPSTFQNPKIGTSPLPEIETLIGLMPSVPMLDTYHNDDFSITNTSTSLSSSESSTSESSEDDDSSDDEDQEEEGATSISSSFGSTIISESQFPTTPMPEYALAATPFTPMSSQTQSSPMPSPYATSTSPMNAHWAMDGYSPSPVPPVDPRRSLNQTVPSVTTSNHHYRQRQKVFHLSMCKLSTFRHDSSLHRSVLIYNTLRRLEKEYEREGVKLNPAPSVGVGSLIPSLGTSDLDGLPNSPLVPPVELAQPVPAVTPLPEVTEPTFPYSCPPMGVVDPVMNQPTDHYVAQPYAKTFDPCSSQQFGVEAQGNGVFWGNGEDTLKEKVDWCSVPSLYSQEPPRQPLMEPLKQPLPSNTLPAVNSINSKLVPMMPVTCSGSLLQPTVCSSSPPLPPVYPPSCPPMAMDASQIPFAATSSNSPAISSSSSYTSSIPVPAGQSTSNSYVNYYTSGDDIFTDIDLSLYDFDVFSSLPPSSGKMETLDEFKSCSQAASSMSCYSYNSSSSSSQSRSMSTLFSSSSTSSQPSASSNCAQMSVAASSSSSSIHHLHHHPGGGGAFYKSPDEEQVAAIKCHN